MVETGDFPDMLNLMEVLLNSFILTGYSERIRMDSVKMLEKSSYTRKNTSWLNEFEITFNIDSWGINYGFGLFYSSDKYANVLSLRVEGDIVKISFPSDLDMNC